jgi:hypothetical protein
VANPKQASPTGTKAAADGRPADGASSVRTMVRPPMRKSTAPIRLMRSRALACVSRAWVKTVGWLKR